MIKIAMFYICKISSTVLKEQYKYDYTTENAFEAYKARQLCGLADNQALRTICKVAEHNGEDNFITEIISIQFSSVKAYDAAITHVELNR